MGTLILHDFRSLPPQFRKDQPSLVAWLASAHARAAIATADPHQRASVERKIKRAIQRVCSATNRVRFRNFSLEDFSHEDWERMRIFSKPEGLGASERSRFFQEVADEAFLRLYPDDAEGPDMLIHVTCTGYVSPSGAQRIVSHRGWGKTTRVVHAYHMGCYAALPSLRIAQGALLSGKSRADLVHTELCTLHLDPGTHSAEQVVVQALFADGLIRYSTSIEAPSARGLALVAHREEILPSTESEITWIASDRGLEIALSREVPDKITQAVRPFLERLLEDSSLDLDEAVRTAIFAIHPGGPRIVDQIREALELDESQVAASNQVLGDRGNMSSATLPHIWKAIVEDDAVEPGRWVISLAFGPGLTVAAAVFRKTGSR